jgi:hypothetical protein
MTTKEEMIELLKTEFPTLKVGSDETGYTAITGNDYDEQIANWAQARLDKEAKQIKAKAEKQAKLDAIDKLTALGIDPKALGLVIEEKPVNGGTLD